MKKRLVARISRLNDLINGNYYIEEGFNPNYLVTDYGLRISRVRVIGTVIEKYVNEDRTYGFIVIDDGTGTIRVKFFKNTGIMESVEKGDIVEVIGKVREYNEERFINAEEIFKRDIHYELLRKIEYVKFREHWLEITNLVKSRLNENDNFDEILKEFKLNREDLKILIDFIRKGFKKEEEVNPRKVIFNLINELDQGEGVDYSLLIEKSGLSENQVEKVINDLLSDGTCYEPKPGVIKKL